MPNKTIKLTPNEVQFLTIWIESALLQVHKEMPYRPTPYNTKKEMLTTLHEKVTGNKVSTNAHD